MLFSELRVFFSKNLTFPNYRRVLTLVHVSSDEKRKKPFWEKKNQKAVLSLQNIGSKNR